jgi:TIR domain
MSVRVFLSYAHEDRAWCERLLAHLGWLRHSGQLVVFDDQQIKPGEQWDERIRGELAGASIVVPLISPSFIGSRYCSVDELMGALQTGKRLIPVLIDHVDLAALPAPPSSACPRTSGRI